MTKKMLIDASHAEETRVVVLDGNRLEDFDVETANRKQIKGNIYLAKVIRVEPSLQAAFVEYGGNRDGFLAFGEIHPDYYQIPVADRNRLLEMPAEDDGAEEARANPGVPAEPPHAAHQLHTRPIEILAAPPPEGETEEAMPPAAPVAEEANLEAQSVPDAESAPAEAASGEPAQAEGEGASETIEAGAEVEAGPPPESLGGDGDDAAEARERRQRQRFLRNYKIQEVIHRRQIMLVQVVKEERGNKGAALTTYLSLAGRYCVLMPNTDRGGGISRKITSATDRKRLRTAVQDLETPAGMGLIVRTAGAKRTKSEIKRDYDYLIRTWDNIRDTTMHSVAPALIYEEEDLVKRAIRDLYDKDLEGIWVEGEAGYKEAREFMRVLMPAQAKKVIAYREPTPLFVRHRIEDHLAQIYSPTVPLKSGGYLVINQTEALVAVDVNSGRATKERNIEATALKTNLEAAEETCRQLRLRDLPGLIVIDFIDMDEAKK